MRGHHAGEDFKGAVVGMDSHPDIFKRQITAHIILADQQEMIVLFAELIPLRRLATQCGIRQFVAASGCRLASRPPHKVSSVAKAGLRLFLAKVASVKSMNCAT